MEEILKYGVGGAMMIILVMAFSLLFYLLWDGILFGRSKCGIPKMRHMPKPPKKGKKKKS